jgi:glycerol-1-phosphate dehydrogenase [NAD(P)+]
MEDLIDKGIQHLAGLSFDCSCGKNHSVNIEKLIISDDISEVLVKALEPFRAGKLFILSDSNTYKIMGANVCESLTNHGFLYKSFTFDTGGFNLIPDERAVGRLLVELEQDTVLILAVGSGVLNDLARIIAYKTGKPFAVACTAPSMDGYASVVSPLIINSKKTTYAGKYPYGIFADINIMSRAPMDMIRAGFGDVLGKLTALSDWRLSNIITGEYYCPTTAILVQNAVDKCIESVAGLVLREPEAIRKQIEALILTGISMGFVGASRPASGTEHQLAHYWEVKAIKEGREHPLHGNAVGVGTVITAMLYELSSHMLPKGFEHPKAKLVAELLKQLGAATSPKEIGIDRYMFVDGMLNAMYLRDKYTLLKFCHERGKLTEFTDILTGRFYD